MLSQRPGGFIIYYYRKTLTYGQGKEFSWEIWTASCIVSYV